MSDKTASDRQRRRFLHTGSAQWRAIREQVLQREPLCRYCTRRGWVVPATDVDHINGQTEDNRLESLQPLCRSCHSEKTARDEHYASTGKWKPMKGCDLQGFPIDDQHPWNRERGQ